MLSVRVRVSKFLNVRVSKCLSVRVLSVCMSECLCVRVSVCPSVQISERLSVECPRWYLPGGTFPLDEGISGANLLLRGISSLIATGTGFFPAFISQPCKVESSNFSKISKLTFNSQAY